MVLPGVHIDVQHNMAPHVVEIQITLCPIIYALGQAHTLVPRLLRTTLFLAPPQCCPRLVCLSALWSNLTPDCLSGLQQMLLGPGPVTPPLHCPQLSFRNLERVYGIWRRLSEVLATEEVSTPVTGMFYQDVVAVMLLYSS